MSHVKEEFLSILKKYEQKYVLIPGGLTWLLQPLDVSINTPIKKALVNKYMNIVLKQEDL